MVILSQTRVDLTGLVATWGQECCQHIAPQWVGDRLFIPQDPVEDGGYVAEYQHWLVPWRVYFQGRLTALTLHQSFSNRRLDQAGILHVQWVVTQGNHYYGEALRDSLRDFLAADSAPIPWWFRDNGDRSEWREDWRDVCLVGLKEQLQIRQARCAAAGLLEVLDSAQDLGPNPLRL